MATRLGMADLFDDDGAAQAESPRAAPERAWLILTRRTLPELAARLGWTIRADHCFQRILLDHAVGGCWYDQVEGRPAYRHIAADRLNRAIALGRTLAAGDADIVALDRQSLAWRTAALRLRRRERQSPVSDDFRGMVSPSSASAG